MDNSDNEVASIGTLSGGVWSWAPQMPITTTSDIVNMTDDEHVSSTNITCPSSTTCIATGNSVSSGAITIVGTLSGGVWIWATAAPLPVDSYESDINSISCPSSTTCITVGTDGSEGVYSIGTLSGGVWTWTADTAVPADGSFYGGINYMNGINCPSSTECVAVGFAYEGGSFFDQPGLFSVATLSG
jgi:hypothetical protein